MNQKEQVWSALQKAAERIGANEYAAGRYEVKRNRKGNVTQGYRISEAHKTVLDTMDALGRDEITPEQAMAVLHEYDVMKGRLGGMSDMKPDWIVDRVELTSDAKRHGPNKVVYPLRVEGQNLSTGMHFSWRVPDVKDPRFDLTHAKIDADARPVVAAQGRLGGMDGALGMGTVKNPKKRLPQYVRQYLETALWSSTGDDDEPLGKKYSVSDFDARALVVAQRDMDRFIKMVSDTVELWPGSKDEFNFDDTDLAHDLWLSRNGHGAGFFDRPEKYGPLANTFQELAKSFGEQPVFEYGDKLGLN